MTSGLSINGTAARWFLRPSASPRSGPRLFCFPCAGFGAAMYREWISQIPGQIEVYPVQPPGRGNRLSEQPLGTIPELVEALLPALLPLTDRPYAFFGHSMGAVFAAMTADALSREGAPPPAHLFLSARQPPDCPSPVPPLGHLDDDAFVAEVNRRYGGIPEEILNEPDILALLLPALRADIHALEAMEGHGPVPLATPITAFGGEGDPIVPPALMQHWQGWAGSGFRHRSFPGGHFYLDPMRGELLRDIAATLADPAGAWLERSA